ncbi:MAG: hypothetical protein KC589_07800 [Nanoarchaeota archaeon]|nr:hypothetical protein [Nanoarchaeota archaeon]
MKNLFLILVLIFAINIGYSANFSVDWNKTIDFVNQWDEGKKLAIDSSGNIYAAGKFDIGPNNAAYIASYDSLGVLRWSKVINYSGGWDEFVDIYIDSSNVLYLTGRSQVGANYGFLTMSYDSLGNHLWNNSIDYVGGHNYGEAIIADDSGNSYVVGRVNEGVNDDVFVVSYNSSGAQRWNDTRTSAAGIDYGRAIVIDSLNNIYIAGDKYVGTTHDVYVASYNSSGNLRWETTFPSTAGTDSGDGIAIDSSRNIYVVGKISNGVNYDFFIVSYNSSGVHRWNDTIDYDGGHDYYKEVKLDALGNVYVVGYGDHTTFNNDGFVISYDNLGNRRWNKTVHFGSDNDYLRYIDIDSSGNSYVTGNSDVGTHNDIILRVYNSSGNLTWSQNIDFFGGNDYPKDILLDASGNFFLTGYVYNSSDYEFLVMKILNNLDVGSEGSSSIANLFPFVGFFSSMFILTSLLFYFVFS